MTVSWWKGRSALAIDNFLGSWGSYSSSGVPSAPHKTQWATQTPVFLGCIWSTQRGKRYIAVPTEKLVDLAAEAERIAKEGKPGVWEVMSLLGKLAFACSGAPNLRGISRCIRMSAPSLGCLSRLPRVAQRKLKVEAEDRALLREALRTVARFVRGGRARRAQIASPGDPELWRVLESDAGTYGLAARLGSRVIWRHCQGQPFWEERSSTWREIWACIEALVTFARELRGRHVLFVLDNAAAASALSRLGSGTPEVNQLVLTACELSMSLNCVVYGAWRRRTENGLMDSCSKAVSIDQCVTVLQSYREAKGGLAHLDPRPTDKASWPARVRRAARFRQPSRRELGDSEGSSEELYEDGGQPHLAVVL